MKPKQIREVVKITIEELMSSNLLKTDDYPIIQKKVEKELNSFFASKPNTVGYSLRQLSDDPYIDIIYLQYRDGKTQEWIAEYMGVDISTVKRNKKRLITAIYNIMREC